MGRSKWIHSTTVLVKRLAGHHTTDEGDVSPKSRNTFSYTDAWCHGEEDLRSQPDFHDSPLMLLIGCICHASFLPGA